MERVPDRRLGTAVAGLRRRAHQVVGYDPEDSRVARLSVDVIVERGLRRRARHRRGHYREALDEPARRVPARTSQPRGDLVRIISAYVADTQPPSPSSQADALAPPGSRPSPRAYPRRSFWTNFYGGRYQGELQRRRRRRRGIDIGRLAYSSRSARRSRLALEISKRIELDVEELRRGA